MASLHRDHYWQEGMCGIESLKVYTKSAQAASKDTLIFRPGSPRQRIFFSVSFNEDDKIRLIDSPNPAVMDAFSRAVLVSRSREPQYHTPP